MLRGCSHQVHFGSFLVVLLQRHFGLLDVLLLFLLGLLGLVSEFSGCHLHVDDGLFHGGHLGRGRFVSHSIQTTLKYITPYKRFDSLLTPLGYSISALHFSRCIGNNNIQIAIT